MGLAPSWPTSGRLTCCRGGGGVGVGLGGSGCPKAATAGWPGEPDQGCSRPLLSFVSHLGPRDWILLSGRTVCGVDADVLEEGYVCPWSLRVGVGQGQRCLFS